jgi:hypothetical protein
MSISTGGRNFLKSSPHTGMVTSKRHRPLLARLHSRLKQTTNLDTRENSLMLNGRRLGSVWKNSERLEILPVASRSAANVSR